MSLFVMGDWESTTEAKDEVMEKSRTGSRSMNSTMDVNHMIFPRVRHCIFTSLSRVVVCCTARYFLVYSNAELGRRSLEVCF